MAGAALIGAGTVLVLTNGTETVYTAKAADAAPLLTHEQLVWLYALEWRESRGKEGAINPKDRDNTPSYGCLQFKPGTFNGYSTQYEVATTSIMSCPEQEAIVAQMILHRDQINWIQQFPLSVKAMGLPPKSPTAPSTP